MIADLVEREWIDKLGTHWEVSARDKSGAVHSQKITKMLTGWHGREDARAAVRAAAARSDQFADPIGPSFEARNPADDRASKVPDPTSDSLVTGSGTSHSPPLPESK